MADFETAHAETMGNEGGFANNPHDVGGMTYKGIAIHYHPTWRGWQYVKNTLAAAVNQPPYGTPEYRNWAKYINGQLAAIPAMQRLVLDFYRTNFWDANRLGEIESQTVANWAYDHAVNAGGRGIKWLQEAAGVTADGSIGPKSVEAINGRDPALLLQEAEDIAAFYRLDKACRDSSQVQFLQSWLTRDGCSLAEVRAVMAAARDGKLTADEVDELKRLIDATA